MNWNIGSHGESHKPFFEMDNKAPLKRNILASNSNIHDELRDLILKKNIE